MFWDREERYFRGAVTDYSEEISDHQLTDSDGETRWEHMSVKKFEDSCTGELSIIMMSD